MDEVEPEKEPFLPEEDKSSGLTRSTKIRQKISRRSLIVFIGIGIVIVIGLAAGLVFNKHSNQIAANNGIHKIKHVIIIMQENRSFDSYFGTFPGADGIPMQ